MELYSPFSRPWSLRSRDLFDNEGWRFCYSFWRRVLVYAKEQWSTCSKMQEQGRPRVSDMCSV